MGNPRPSGYGLFAHQRDQNWLTRTLSFCDLKLWEGSEGIKPLLPKRGRRAEKLFAITKFENMFIFAQIHRLQSDFIMKRD